MPAVPTVGTLNQFGIGTANPTTSLLEYTSFGLGKHGTVLSTDGIRGTRSHPVERTRAGVYTISGQIVTHPGPADLDVLLPFITGTTKNGSNQFPLAEALTSVTAYIQHDSGAKVFTYAGCQADKYAFKASQGGLLELAMDWEALTESIGNAGTFPSLTATTAAPFVLMDAVLTIGGGASKQFREMEVVIDNHLKKDRHMNSSARTDVVPASSASTNGP